MSYKQNEEHLLGMGGTAEVYWIDEARAVKVIHVGFDKEKRESTMAEIAYMDV